MRHWSSARDGLTRCKAVEVIDLFHEADAQQLRKAVLFASVPVTRGGASIGKVDTRTEHLLRQSEQRAIR